MYSASLVFIFSSKVHQISLFPPSKWENCCLFCFVFFVRSESAVMCGPLGASYTIWCMVALHSSTLRTILGSSKRSPTPNMSSNFLQFLILTSWMYYRSVNSMSALRWPHSTFSVLPRAVVVTWGYLSRSKIGNSNAVICSYRTSVIALYYFPSGHLCYCFRRVSFMMSPPRVKILHVSGGAEVDVFAVVCFLIYFIRWYVHRKFIATFTYV